MTTLVLRLAGPMQAWATDSRFGDRRTGLVPSKSGVIGMLMAALGSHDDQTVEMFANMGFAVRADRPGTIGWDFQTAKGHEMMPLSNRSYLCDAVFTVFLETGDPGFAGTLVEAIENPVNTIYLGRKTCLPAGHITVGLYEEGIDTLITTIAHQGGAARPTTVTVHRDGTVDDHTMICRDVPVSFLNRVHRDRFVKVEQVTIPAAEGARGEFFDRYFSDLPKV